MTKGRYEVRFYYNCSLPPSRRYRKIAGPFDTLEQAKNARVIAGDLVVDLRTRRICCEMAWLWDNEKENPESFARKRISESLRLYGF